jgi:hypothetical protein
MRKRNSHIFERAANDLYVEPSWYSARLFEVEQFPEPVWDPCCGTGTIPKAAKAAGLECCASDIADHGYGKHPWDFLLQPALTPPPFSVITNPPYSKVLKIVERGLELGAMKVAILFPTACVNAAWHWLEPLPFAKEYRLIPRPSVPPITAKKVGGGRGDFSWIVIDRRHRGPPTLCWLHRDNATRFQRETMIKDGQSVRNGELR